LNSKIGSSPGTGLLDVIQQFGAKLGYGPLGRASDD
jgi:hypothetical protein